MITIDNNNCQNKSRFMSSLQSIDGLFPVKNVICQAKKIMITIDKNNCQNKMCIIFSASSKSWYYNELLVCSAC